MALIQETNKKRKSEIDDFRDDLSEIGRLTLEMIAQYQPNYTFNKKGEVGMESKTIEFPLEYLWDGIKVDLVASSEMLNTEARREIALASYQLMSRLPDQTGGDGTGDGFADGAARVQDVPDASGARRATRLWRKLSGTSASGSRKTCWCRCPHRRWPPPHPDGWAAG
ncbi:MAG: hypothetical protein MZV70_03310 [Desulfobacterales bacterium]|nr:hypothetical protein [Desulfobacterales bacterium]